MDVRKAALKALIKIIEKRIPADEVLKYYSDKVLVASELIGLVSGSVKYKLTLDFYIQEISNKKLKDLSHVVLNSLRLAVYELQYLHTPDYAVLNSYVELVKHYDKRSAAFVNGILRNFLRKDRNVELPSISIKYSHPEWLVERWIKHYGINDTVKICKYNNLAPKLVIKANTLKISKAKLKEFFEDKNISFSDDRLAPESLILHYQGKINEIPGFNEGYWLVQGESSSIVSLVLDPQEGERILDMCAAPGGKTSHIAALIKDNGSITAVDINSRRLTRINDNCLRLGISSVTTKTADATKYSSDEVYDRILIDAPCSNTGVLGKRIDARWNKTQQDIENLSGLQLEILNNAANLVKNDGIIVYSTCSIEPEENEQIIEEFRRRNQNFVYETIAPYLPFEIEEDKGYIQILQSKQNIDGFFIAKLRKTT